MHTPSAHCRSTVLTPGGRADVCLPADVPVLIFHVKPQFHDEIGEELGRIAGHRISFMEQDKSYLF